MKTNQMRNEVELHNRIESLEKENVDLKEKVSDCVAFIKILEEWLADDEENNDIDCGTYNV